MTICGCGTTGGCNCFIIGDPSRTMFVSGQGTLKSPLTFAALQMPYTRPTAKATRSTTQSITTGVLTAVSFDAETFDTDNMVDTAGFPTRITINTPGVYYMGGTVPWTATGDQPYRLGIRRNGGLTMEVYDDVVIAASGISPISHCLSDLYVCLVGEYFELMVLQSTGGSVTIDPTATLTGSGGTTPIAFFAMYMGRAG